jgi:hypothetical protein
MPHIPYNSFGDVENTNNVTRSSDDMERHTSFGICNPPARTLIIPNLVITFISDILSRYAPFDACKSYTDEVCGFDTPYHVHTLECGGGGHCFYHCISAALSGIHMMNILPYWENGNTHIIKNDLNTVCMLRKIVNTYIELKKAWFIYYSSIKSTVSERVLSNVRNELSLSHNNTRSEHDIDRTRCGVEYSVRDIPYADTPDVFGMAHVLGIHILIIYTFDGVLVHSCEHINGTNTEWESVRTPNTDKKLARPEGLVRNRKNHPLSDHIVILVHKADHYQLGNVTYYKQN